jgi:hypothetical protein
MKSLGVPEEWISFDLLSHILKGNSDSFDDLKSRIAGVALTVLDAASSDSEAIQIVNSGAEALVSTLSPLVRNACVTPANSVPHLSWGTYEKSDMQRYCLAEVRERGGTVSGRRNRRRCFYFRR